MENVNKSILITGATGYIATHTIVELVNRGYEIVGIDNLVNSSKKVLDKTKEITGESIKFFESDLRERDNLRDLFEKFDFKAVIHFAGYKAVGESVLDPLLYYSNNLSGTITLLDVMKEYAVKSIVFSSSCTVYGSPDKVPVDEGNVISPQNPYGRTKAYIDQILEDISNSDPDWSIISLRYFNPIGAHESGLIGEDPNGIPNNLVPFITQTAVGKLEKLSVFGNDYPTKDGTCIRDYIHVVDLAIAHLKALEHLEKNSCEFINLGTGKGYSVLEVIRTFEKVNNVKIPFEISPRREGDAVEVFAKPDKADKLLDWKAKRSLEKMLKDAWNFQQKNPNGYK